MDRVERRRDASQSPHPPTDLQTETDALAGLLPDPSVSDEQQARFFHDDVPQLSDERVWAEKVVLTAALAELIFQKQRPRLIWVSGCNQLTDQEWLRERLRRLKSRGPA